MRMLFKFVLGAILLLIAVGIIGAWINTNPLGRVISGVNNGPLKILSSEKIYDDYENVIIEGVAENTGNKKLNYAQLNAKFYDKEGNVIGSSFDNINDLGAGETWKFRISYWGADSYNINSYNLSVGTSW